MTPAARIAAASDILDLILQGEPAEQCLTNWARRSRFAGSGDRHAVRDLVFDALRRKRSLAWLGGGETGRALMIGKCRADGDNLDDLFSGEGHAPRPLSESERGAARDLSLAPEAVRLDCPDWLLPLFRHALGDRVHDVLGMLQVRAPVFLRVNTSRGSRENAIEQLQRDGISAEEFHLSDTALLVTANARRVHASTAYTDGFVELQDAASQAVIDLLLPHVQGARVLDFCAGGGGKALNLAVGGAGQVVAYDVSPDRMKDIPVRADRAGVSIEIVREPQGPFDCVLADVPCSGTGAWRRQPEAKWRFDEGRLRELQSTQAEIMERAADFVRLDGILAYVTCSMLEQENATQVEEFLSRQDGWLLISSRRFTPLDGGDGFFVSLFRKTGK